MLNQADLILFNGRVHTKDREVHDATAVAISNGRFLAVGSDEEVMRYRCAHTDMVNLDGRRLMPGFFQLAG